MSSEPTNKGRRLFKMLRGWQKGSRILILLMTVGLILWAVAETGWTMPAHPDLQKRIQTWQRQGITLSPFLADPNFKQKKGIDQAAPQKFGKQPPSPFKALVLLVEFTDNPSSVGATFFDNLIFAAPPANSVRDYFSDLSYGNFDLVTVNLPSAVGWLTAPNPYNGSSGYVNADGICGTADDYGFGTFPQNAQGIVWDAVTLADPVVDFSQYDNDGDGVVDTLFVVHAGPGAEFTGDCNDVWSHAWSLPGAGLAVDGVNVDPYSMEPEFWASPGDMTIGVFAHEAGHSIFGLPDLYDRDYSSDGLGPWSLMAGGSWNGTLGDSPSWPDAWSHVQMGFVTPVTGYDFNVIRQKIAAVENTPNRAIYRINSPFDPNEYWLIENRRLVGYDAALPGAGFHIYHVDENVTTQNDKECTAVNNWNCGANHYLVAMEQADGNFDLENGSWGDAGDPWRSGDVFDFTSIPNSSSYYSSSNTCVGVKGFGWTSGYGFRADLLVRCDNPSWPNLLFYEGKTPDPFLAGGPATLEGNYNLMGNDLITYQNYNVHQTIAPLSSSLLAPYDAVLILAPTDSFSSSELAVLQTYVGSSGRVALFCDSDMFSQSDSSGDGLPDYYSHGNYNLVEPVINWAADSSQGLILSGEWGGYASGYYTTNEVASLFGLSCQGTLVEDPTYYDTNTYWPLIGAVTPGVATGRDYNPLAASEAVGGFPIGRLSGNGFVNPSPSLPGISPTTPPGAMPPVPKKGSARSPLSKQVPIPPRGSLPPTTPPILQPGIYTGPSVVAGQDMSQPIATVEVGVVSINHNWATVNLTKTFTDPIVVAKPLSLNGGQPAVVRIRNVTPTSFQIRVQEWNYLDGSHAYETVAYLVVERGHWYLANGAQIEAGSLSFSGLNNWQSVTFSTAFPTAPVVLSVVGTFNGTDTVATRNRNVSATGFQVAMQEQENKLTSGHTTETIYWIAWEPGTGEVNDPIAYEAGTTTGVKHTFKTINFTGSYGSAPCFLADMQTTNGGDPANVRYKNLTTASIQVQIDEEQSKDSETHHTGETVGYLAFDCGAAPAPSAAALEEEPRPGTTKALQVKGITLAQESGGVTFRVEGLGIRSMEVEVFDLSGRKVYESGLVAGTQLRWNLLNDRGQQVANGVYLYVVTVRGATGEVVRTDVRKLVVLR